MKIWIPKRAESSRFYSGEELCLKPPKLVPIRKSGHFFYTTIMIINSDNYKMLAETTTVKENDLVVFEVGNKTYEYFVKQRWLAPKEDWMPETTILIVLRVEGLISGSLQKFCSEAYGYQARGHEDEQVWPECVAGDYLALTRLIFTIFELLNSKDLLKIELIDTPQISFL